MKYLCYIHQVGMEENMNKIERFINDFSQLNIKKKCFYYSVCIIALISLFFLLMVVNMMIPTNLYEQNAIESISYIESEGNYYVAYDEKLSGQADNFTDKLMIEKTLKNHDVGLIENAVDINGYQRYWHGYLFFLKPLLCIMTYTNIRVCLSLIFILLMTLVAIKIYKMFGYKFSIAFALSITCFNISVIYRSLQYSNMFILMLLITLIMLTILDRYKNDQFITIYFIICGGLTCFLDLLTTPIITFGIPMTLYYLWCLKYKNYNVKEHMKIGVKLLFSWGISYGIIWISKWVIASFILKKNIISNALEAILFRTATDGQYISKTTMLYNNFIRIEGVKVLGILFFVFLLLSLYKIIRKKEYFKFKQMLLFAFIGFLPIFWYLGLSNHSFIHSFFTYRSLFVFVFSFAIMFMYALSNLDQTNKDNEVF